MPKTIKSRKGKDNGNYKHGGKHTKLYEVWRCMKQRCNNKRSKMYKYYGEKGVKVCDDWQTDYSSFRKWSIENGYSDGLTIDRIDNNGDYSPSNCRWVTRKIQANNQTTTTHIEYLGFCRTLHEWSDILGINPNTLYFRIYKRGWSIERAFTEKASLNKHSRETVDIKEKNKIAESKERGMIRKFCDRCGVECEYLTDIKIPLENHVNGSFSTKGMAVCDKCYEIHENIIETLAEIRISMYANLFHKGSADDDT